MTSENGIEKNPDYVVLTQALDKANQDTKAKATEVRRQLDDTNARLLAVQSVFTDRRAYVNALTYEFETSTSASSKAGKQKKSTPIKRNSPPLNFPTAAKRNSPFHSSKKPTTRFVSRKQS